jgi:hypothetical protein
VGHDINLGNGSYIHADSVGYSHACSGCGSVTPDPVLSPVPADPLSMLTPPPDTGTVDSNCPNPKPISGNITLSGGHYCGWRFTDKGNTLTLNPGIYYMTGPIETSNPGRDANIVGSGVMIYLAPGASINLDANHVSINLSGYTADPYKGILFYQDRANTADADFAKNNGDFTFSGASYFPSANLSIKNNLGWTGDCVLFVAKGLEVKNNANISNDCGGFSGGTPLQSVALAE